MVQIVDVYDPNNYYALRYWGVLRVQYLRKELAEAEQNLKDFDDKWARFIHYCHTGKFPETI